MTNMTAPLRALRKLVDIGGYQSHILFLDVPDFHQESGMTSYPMTTITMENGT